MHDAISPAVLAAVSITLIAEPASADRYQDVFAQATVLEGAGQLNDAVHALETLLPEYAQDYELPLQIGWLHTRAGRPSEAERYYRLALARSPGGVDARLGLALALERQERCGEARPLLQGLATEHPELAAAQQALVRCSPLSAWTMAPSLLLTGVYFPGHPTKWLTGGGTVSGLLFHRSGWHGGAAYRYSRFVFQPGAGSSAWDQHEGHASVGVDAAMAGVRVSYAVVYSGNPPGASTSGSMAPSGLNLAPAWSHHVGLTSRISLWGDIEVQASASLYADMVVMRVEPSWKMPLGGGLSVRPGVGIQSAGGEALATAMGTLAWERPRFRLWLGGKVGDELRPVYLLAVPVVYNLPEKIPYGFWVGGNVNVSIPVGIHLSYAMDRLRRQDGGMTNAHALTTGVVVSF